MPQHERVAIVSAGGTFPGSADLEQFWTNVAGGVDTTRQVPPGRWAIDPDEAFDPRLGLADRVSSVRGGFIDGFVLDCDGLDLDPEIVDRLDPMFHLVLHAGRAAWRAARTERLDRRRVGVVLGNIVLPTETASALARTYLGRSLAEQVGIFDEGNTGLEIEPRNRHVAGLPAGLLAEALGLGGGCYTLDAACASSLYALKRAADDLLAHRVDAMLAGGLSRPDALYTQMGFTQLRALSPSGRARPFDAGADGLVVGEGAGVFVLKRLSDAIDQGDTILGLIAGVGLSNDVDGGLLAPSTEGQLRALRAAYEQAGWEPDAVDLIECHATGTPLGDAVELASLRELWKDVRDPETREQPRRCVLSSVKSNIGHALTAAGAAGLLKVLLALKHEVLPPTANFTNPAQAMTEGPFQVLARPEAWERRGPGVPRRAAISGFGFGGINAHVLIEEFIPGSATSIETLPPTVPVPVSASAIAIVGMSAHFGPFQGLRAFQERVLGGERGSSTLIEPIEPQGWWGARGDRMVSPGRFRPEKVQGVCLDSIDLRRDRFRIPPRELEEMLPQQSIALLAAAEAVADAGWEGCERPRLRTGVTVGIELDLNTTNFHLRWLLPGQARRWARKLGLDLSEAKLAEWVEALRDAAGPALSANRTMGALGGLVASRIARELRLGGPSFTVSSEETSGARALEVAVRALQSGELDEAVVASVDLTCDVRAILATESAQPYATRGAARPLSTDADGTVPGDGAAALVLKRLEDARRDGDRIYAIVRGIGLASSGTGERTPSAYLAAANRALVDAGLTPESASIGYLEAHGSGRPEEDRREALALSELGAHGSWSSGRCAVGSVKADVGHAGASAALAGLVKASLCLHQQIVPPLRGVETARKELQGASNHPSTCPGVRSSGSATGPRDRGERRSRRSGSAAARRSWCWRPTSRRPSSQAPSVGSRWGGFLWRSSPSKETSRETSSAGSNAWKPWPRGSTRRRSRRSRGNGGGCKRTTPGAGSDCRSSPTGARHSADG